MIGDRAPPPSGGQRQRINIAAPDHRATHLILDEPPPPLDAESEELVIDALERPDEGHTVIAVATTQHPTHRQQNR
jgi:ABC-type bacteriocin/lantibiotic exporter with double-glycine peptidase domain